MCYFYTDHLENKIVYVLPQNVLFGGAKCFGGLRG